MNINLTYFSLQLKKIIQFFPRLIAGTIVLAVLAGAIAFYGANVLYSESSARKISIGVVIDDDSTLMDLAMTYLESSDSINSFCMLIPVSKKEAEHMLREKSIAAYMHFPKDFAKDIVNGANTPAIIYFSEDCGVEQLVFQELAAAASRILNYAQASIYSMSDIYEEYYLKEKRSIHFDYINQNTMQTALIRSELFRPETVSSTGALSVKDYYLVSGIILLFFLTGMSLGKFSEPEYGSLARMLTLKGVTVPLRTFWKLMALICFYLLMGSVFLTIGCIAGIFPWTIFIVLPGIVLVAGSQTLCLYSLAFNETNGTLLVFFYTLISAFCSGCLIPAAFLPQGVVWLDKIFPMSDVRNFIAAAFEGTFSWESLPGLFIFAVVFFVLSCFGGWKAERRAVS